MKFAQTFFPVLAIILAATVLSHAADTSAKPATSTNLAAAKSTFTIPSSSKEGRDPFFPESTRPLSAKPIEPGTNSTTSPATTAPDAVVVNGITIDGAKSSAMINGHSYRVGDRDNITTKSGKISIHCLEIRANSVILELNGVKQELRYKN